MQACSKNGRSAVTVLMGFVLYLDSWGILCNSLLNVCCLLLHAVAPPLSLPLFTKRWVWCGVNCGLHTHPETRRGLICRAGHPPVGERAEREKKQPDRHHLSDCFKEIRPFAPHQHEEKNGAAVRGAARLVSVWLKEKIIVWKERIDFSCQALLSIALKEVMERLKSKPCSIEFTFL